jgi:hypothetical protein
MFISSCPCALGAVGLVPPPAVAGELQGGRLVDIGDERSAWRSTGALLRSRPFTWRRSMSASRRAAMLLRTQKAERRGCDCRAFPPSRLFADLASVEAGSWTRSGSNCSNEHRFTSVAGTDADSHKTALRRSCTKACGRQTGDLRQCSHTGCGF